MTPRIRLMALAAFAATAVLPAMAQDKWPSKPIEIIYPYPPGNDMDVVTRLLAEGMSKRLGVPVQVFDARTHADLKRMLFALGQLCRRTELWGKAQSYLEASLGLKPEVDTHLALAHLFDTLERRDDAQRHYRAAAERVAGAAV